MSQSIPVLDMTRMAAADLSTKQFYAVIISAENTVNVAGANAAAIGVLQDLPNAAGIAARVRVLGTSKGTAGGAFSAGARLATDASGKFVTATAGQNSPAQAIEASLADGNIVEIALTPGGSMPA